MCVELNFSCWRGESVALHTDKLLSTPPSPLAAARPPAQYSIDRRRPTRPPESRSIIIDTSALVAAVLAVLASIGGGVAWLAKLLAGEREKQRKHERETSERFATAVGDVHAAALAEARASTNALLDIQNRSITTLSSLGHELNALSSAVTELRSEVARKVDRPDAPPPTRKPSS